MCHRRCGVDRGKSGEHFYDKKVFGYKKLKERVNKNWEREIKVSLG